MVKGRLYIDGKDAFAEYGVFVEQYGYNGLVQMPPFKDLETTEWPEEDGAEVDLSAPALASKTFSLPLCATHAGNVRYLFEALSQEGAYHVFEFAELKRAFQLRMVQNGAFSTFIETGKLTLSFADDFPVVPAFPDSPPLSAFTQTGYEIDGIRLSKMGVYVRKETDGNLLKSPAARQNLTVDVASAPGLLYDGAAVTYKPKDAELKLFIHSGGIDTFWQCWDCLFGKLLQSGTRVFSSAILGKECECHYKGCNVERFDILRNGHVWCEFSVTLVLLSYRPQGSYLLAGENGDWITTEEKANAARITLLPKAVPSPAPSTSAPAARSTQAAPVRASAGGVAEDRRKRVSELPLSESTEGLYTLGVDNANESVKVPLGSLLQTAQSGSTARFGAMVEDATLVGQASTQAGGSVVWVAGKKVFGYSDGSTAEGTLYKEWPTADSYMNKERTEALKEKIYLLGEKAYVWSEEKSNLVQVGSAASLISYELIKP